jgi:hypothetical protein
MTPTVRRQSCMIEDDSSSSIPRMEVGNPGSVKRLTDSQRPNLPRGSSDSSLASFTKLAITRNRALVGLKSRLFPQSAECSNTINANGARSQIFK